MDKTTETVITFIDVTCPSCFAGEGEGEPCSKYCNDDYVGTVKGARKGQQWDDGEQW